MTVNIAVIAKKFSLQLTSLPGPQLTTDVAVVWAQKRAGGSLGSVLLATSE